eukprot:90543_1
MGNQQAPAAAPKQHVQFKLHIAIDFGTDGCGIAFAHREEIKKDDKITYQDKVQIYNKWRGKKKQRTTKTKTHILLNEENEVVCFGNNARYIYSNLQGKERKTKKLFERFKMALYEENIKSDHSVDVDTKEYINACNDERLEASIVFEQAFKRLQELAKGYLSKVTTEQIDDKEIQWILTVPAIWSESAKDKMRKWIAQAGLVDDTIIDQCIIVYEPDCASLALQKEYFQNIYDNEGNQIAANPTDDVDIEDDWDDDIKHDRFEPGDIYILCDAGGGTVDVACHQVLKDGSVEEIIWPTGGDWGSCYIDDLYIKLLQDIFSKEWMDEYKREAPNDYVLIADHFQVAKKQFYENKEAKTHRTQVPFEFVQFLEERCDTQNCEVEDKVHQYCKTVQYYRQLFKDEDCKLESKADDTDECSIKLISSNDNNKFTEDVEYFQMDSVIWECLFDAKIDRIISHIHELLKRPLLQEDCKYLCLVGGFSSSKYLQTRIKDAFGPKSKYNLRFIIPSKPILSVVQGAAYFGIEKDYIKARKLKYTYGVNVYVPKDYALTMGISSDYIESNITKEGMVKNCFRIIARKDDRVAFNEVKENKTYRVPGQNKAFIAILCSDMNDPKVAADGRLLGSIEVKMDSEDKHGDVMTEFHFYGTMFKVYSYPKSKPDQRTELEITYEK